MNLGILFGGNSLEHEISIVSAYGVKKKLEANYGITMLYIDHQNRVYNADRVSLNDFKYNRLKKLKKTRFAERGVRKKRLDCMILCVHGENGEDGLAAALCRFYHIPYVGSNLLASSIGMDKMACFRYLSKNGIPMIESVSYTYEDYINEKKFDRFPCILKPLNGGSSIGIFVCKTAREFNDAVVQAFAVSNKLIIQPFYENLTEYNLAIYENGYSKLERIVKKDEIFSFDNKYNESFKMMHQALENTELAEEFRRIGRTVYDLLDCSGIIRIDFFEIEGKIYVNEVNIIPGALAMYLFEDFMQVIQECIKNAVIHKDIIYKRGNFLAKSDINK